MFIQKTDLPLWEDPSAKYVPWIIALMVYLATIVLTLAIATGDAMNAWDRGYTNKVTVEIPPRFEGVDPLLQGQQQDHDVQAVMNVLKQVEGIKAFRPIPTSEIVKMMRPWVGEKINLDDLPLSTLIEVELIKYDPHFSQNLEGILRQGIPMLQVEDHRIWQKGLFNVLLAAKVVGFGIVLLIILAVIGTIMFTTKTSLTIHSKIIEILHLIGAHNLYIAKQFQTHTMQLGLRGGFIGFFLTVLTLILMRYFMRDIDLHFLTGSLSAWDVWAVAIMIPLLITAFMMISARTTVLLMLKRLY